MTAALLVLAALWMRWSSVRHGIWVDLDVYVRGAQALLHGERLYDVRVHDLPFTYSPFAAVLFTPLALIPAVAARVVLSGLSLASYAVVCAVFSRRLQLPWGVTAVVAVGGLALEPFSRNLLLGQINLLLMVLVVLDCLVVPQQARGWLVGVAAGVKILPGAFVLYFALKREWRAVAQSASGFLVSVLVGAVVSPEATWRYWSGGFGSLGRFGVAAIVGTDNQSLSAVWMRLSGESATSGRMTVALGVVGIALSLWAAHRQLSGGQDIAALVCIALGSLLASPVSWTHHWLWIVPALLVLVAQRRWVWTWSLGLIFWSGPMWFLVPGQLRGLQFTWWQEVIGAAYVVVGISLLFAFAVLWQRRGRVQPLQVDERMPTRTEQELAVQEIVA